MEKVLIGEKVVSFRRYRDWSKEVARNEGRCVSVRLHASEHSEKFSRRTRVYLHLCASLHAHACIYIGKRNLFLSLSVASYTRDSYAQLPVTECIHLAASLPDTYPPPTPPNHGIVYAACCDPRWIRRYPTGIKLEEVL